jgi:hypothetical protein
MIAGLLAAAAGAARADDTSQGGVRPRATVEVIDDKAEIDDVISRLQRAPPVEKVAPADERGADQLKAARPPLLNVAPGEKKSGGNAEGKTGPWRRPHRERGSGAPERTERPRRGKL